MSKKKMAVANFNVVFWGENEESPMLDYFDLVIMPAFRSGITRKSGDSRYMFLNVEVVEDDEGEFVLCGNIVKKTTLEVKSDLDEQGNLITLDNKYPSAPFSSFVIYLKNHRMVFVENQKGSPHINNFSAFAKYAIAMYVNKKNRELENEGLKQIPLPIVNIVGIPMRKNIEDALKEVKRINKLTLRFYPLNGDIDYTKALNGLRRDLLRGVDSNGGDVVIKTPKNTIGVVDLVSQSEGTVEPIFNVTYPNKSKGKITNDQISERMDININGNNIKEELSDITSKGKLLSSVSYTSVGNKEIYEKNKAKIIPFVKR